MQTITLKQTAPAATGSITDRVKTFEDACKVLSISGDILTASIHDELMPHAESIRAYTQLIIIAAALNEGWKPDWTNSRQYKWYLWYNMGSGVGLSYDDADTWNTHTFVGSRLCFKSKELAEYAGKQFIDIYTQFFIIK